MYTENLNKIKKEDIEIAGGKGASLGEMINAGFAVPRGFVVLEKAFTGFLIENKIKDKIISTLDSININEDGLVRHASKKIEQLILNNNIPEKIVKDIMGEYLKLNEKYVAVRSSATVEDGGEATWAGQLDSFLNVSEEDVFENIKKCWASFFTSRAIYYRYYKNIENSVFSLAVVIQRMVNAEKSGVAFSVHPVTKDNDKIIIESSWGLGEAVVSGQVTPDEYIFSKSLNKVITRYISIQRKGLYRSIKGSNEWREVLLEKGSRSSLDDDQTNELARLVIKIENYHKKPQDVEWAIENGIIFIVQSRPVTTL